jgi:hypothetical protein
MESCSASVSNSVSCKLSGVSPSSGVGATGGTGVALARLLRFSSSAFSFKKITTSTFPELFYLCVFFRFKENLSQAKFDPRKKLVPFLKRKSAETKSNLVAL